MHILDTHEFFEMYRGDKDFRLGIELCKNYKLKYTALVPNTLSPADRVFFNTTKFSIDLVPKLPDNMHIKFINSKLIYFSKPEVSLGGRFFQLSLQYPKQIKQLNPDIIFESIFTTLTPRSYMTFVMAKLRHIPMVYLDSGDVPKKGALQRLLNRVEKHVIVRGKKIITYSENGKQRFIQEYKCPEHKITVIPKPIDIDEFDPSRKHTQLRKTLGIDDSIVVSYIGRLSEDKGPRYLLEVAKICKEANEKYHFLFVGANVNDKEVTKLKAYSNKHGLDNVSYTGNITHSEISQYYGVSDIIVFPDITKLTGFPTVLAESMAMGKPIILGIKGYEKATPIKHLETGIIIEPRNAEQIKYWLEILRDDKELRAKLEHNVREYTEHHMSWKKQVMTYMKIFERAIDEN